MNPIPDIVPISDLRREAAATVDRARESAQPVYITQRGRTAAVLIDVREYEKLLDRLECLEIEVRAHAEIAAGVFHDADDVMVEMDELIAHDD